MLRINEHKPPRWAAWILFRMTRHTDRYSLLDDLEIEYKDLVSERGRLFASVWYILHVLRAVPELLYLHYSWRLTMFKNYFKIAFRKIKRQKGYSFINISGLAIGMTCCILILLWVQDELGYDKFHENADYIYRVIKIWRKGEIAHYATTPAPLAQALKEEFPEISNSARFDPAGQMIVAHDKTTFYENNVAYADPSFFELFTLPFIKGDPRTALSSPSSIVITEDMADKYFGTENAVGKTLRINNQFDFLVTGIIYNIPRQSHMQFVNFFIPFTRIKEIQGRGQETHVDWHNTSFYTYVLLQKNIPYQDVSGKISEYLRKHIPENSLAIILNFSTPEQLETFLNDAEYHKIYVRLDTYAIKRGAKVQHFTNP